MINSILGSLGNMAALDLTFGLPRYEEGVPSAYRLAEDTAVVAVSVLFQIQTHSIAGELAVVFDASALDGVCDALLDDSPGAEDRASP